MDISQLVTKINSLLSTYNYYQKPNQPNKGGEIKQSDVSYVIESGNINSENSDLVDITIKFLVTANYSKTPTLDPENDLNSRIQKLVYDLHKQRVSDNGLLMFQNFTMFSPESGKWRGVIEFLTQVEMIYDAGLVPERCIIEPPTGLGENSLDFSNGDDIDNTMYIPLIT